MSINVGKRSGKIQKIREKRLPNIEKSVII